MPDRIDASLLGRRYVPDDRDYRLEDYLAATDPLDTALAALVASNCNTAVKAWAKVVTPYLKTIPAPAPPPAPATDVVWADADTVLDQGQTPHCVGFGWAGWGDALPVDDRFTNADGDAIYYEAKVIDGEPGQEDGSDVRSGAKAMQNRGRLSAYAFTTSVPTVRAFLAAHGPVVFGSDWYDAMFTPDANGFVAPSGSVAGGHCYVCVGDVPSKGALLFQNSWGDWGPLHGRFYMTYTDAQALLSQQGEACSAVELPA